MNRGERCGYGTLDLRLPLAFRLGNAGVDDGLFKCQAIEYLALVAIEAIIVI